ncbi:MAG: tRNA glutamyl-Q(34) synthetase GluQRS [Porticoccaceae bacterium]|nr:tRNA glutamyl-Q(34) synthetase GluQRS [Porticoccaceae bacterium]
MSQSISVGRFAPSPTGPLHFGSLIAALSSFIHAKYHKGKWLVRIEDIDPPREVPGSSDRILRQLEQHGLIWDDQVLYQSSRLDSYNQILQSLRDHKRVYYCQCNRQRLVSLGGVYDGNCRNLALGPQDCALRLAVTKALSSAEPETVSIGFTDNIMGNFSQQLTHGIGDFVLRRRDGLIAYQLAVVIDDQYQGITQVVRGADLLDSTPKQILLQQCLGYQTPEYTHIPLAVNSEGQKLSKQTFAKTLTEGHERENLWIALKWLQQDPPQELRQATVEEIINWGIEHWDLTSIPTSMQAVPAFSTNI